MSKLKWKCRYCLREQRFPEGTEVRKARCQWCGGYVVPLNDKGKIYEKLDVADLHFILNIVEKCTPPKPEPDEKENEFIPRCIRTLAHEAGDEFTNDQRIAICYSVWRKEDVEYRKQQRLLCKKCGYSTTKHLVDITKVEMCPKCFIKLEADGEPFVPDSVAKDKQRTAIEEDGDYYIIRIEDVNIDECKETDKYSYLKKKKVKAYEKDGRLVALRIPKKS